MLRREEISVVRALAAIERACKCREREQKGSGITWFGAVNGGRDVGEKQEEDALEKEPPTLRELDFLVVDVSGKVNSLEKESDVEQKERIKGYQDHVQALVTRVNKMVEEEKRKKGENSSVVNNLAKTTVERKERSADTAAAAEVVEAEAGGERGTKQGGGDSTRRTAAATTARATAGTKATGTAVKTHATRRKELLSATTTSSAASEDTSTAHEEQANRVLDDIFQGLQAFRQAAVAAGNGISQSTSIVEDVGDKAEQNSQAAARENKVMEEQTAQAAMSMYASFATMLTVTGTFLFAFLVIKITPQMKY